MPAGSAVAAVEAKLKSKYGSNDHAVYGTLNKIGLMRGNKVTKKGKRASKLKARKVSYGAMMGKMASGQ